MLILLLSPSTEFLICYCIFHFHNFHLVFLMFDKILLLSCCFKGIHNCSSIFMMTMVKSLSDNSRILFILVLSPDIFSHSSCDFSVFYYGKWFSNVSWTFWLLFWDILGPNEVFCFISHLYHVCCRLWFSLSYLCLILRFTM